MWAWQSQACGGNANRGARGCGSGGTQTGMLRSRSADAGSVDMAENSQAGDIAAFVYECEPRNAGESSVSQGKPVEYADASAQVRAVFDDIKRTRGVEDVNNFWKYLAQDPALLTRTWQSLKEVMAAGALAPLVKEMIYVA